MSIYTDQSDEIKTQLQAVSGIGNVYAVRPNTTDEAKFQQDYVVNNIVNSAFVVRVDGTEAGEVDEANEIEIVNKNDFWELTLFYGYNEAAPSEDFFQALVDGIEEQFRFLQDLNGISFFSYPLQRTQCGLFVFFTDVLCHKAVWRLQVTSRIINTN